MAWRRFVPTGASSKNHTTQWHEADRSVLKDVLQNSFMFDVVDFDFVSFWGCELPFFEKSRSNAALWTCRLSLLKEESCSFSFQIDIARDEDRDINREA